MNHKKNWIGGALLLALMGLTLVLLLRDQPFGQLAAVLGRIRPQYAAAGLALMFLFVGCEAMCSKLILTKLGHAPKYRRCLGYSFVGFYVSSITPSATGGQPAQIYYMNRDGIPPAHGALNMMLIAVCYQVTILLYAVAALIYKPSLLAAMGSGLGLLLLYGAGIMLVLT
ncbi:MAG: lysylphosphatidylglycerol synthase transmembrane domain-containing protein, partial [Pseudoflavonifractor sp.]